MHANKRQELDKVYAGDIAAAVGFKFTVTGDTICDEQHPVILESMEFPDQLSSWQSSRRQKPDRARSGESLSKTCQKKIRPSVRIQIKKQDRRLSQVWESSIWKSS